MAGKRTLTEQFIPIGVEGDEADVHWNAPFASAEAVAAGAFEGLEDNQEIDLVVTTHCQDATDECNALLRKIRKVSAGLAEFGISYQVLDTLEQNIERLEFLREGDPPKGFY